MLLSERRLARLLLLLANFGKEGSPQPISPNVRQETLAEMIGTTLLLREKRTRGHTPTSAKLVTHSALAARQHTRFWRLIRA